MITNEQVHKGLGVGNFEELEEGPNGWIVNKQEYRVG